MATLFSELKSIFEVEVQGPLENMIRFVPLERLNALLVVASTQRHFKSVAEWIERLDQDTEEAGQSLFVYQVRNLKAADLAATLRQLFGGTQNVPAVPEPVIAPGLRPATVESRNASGARPALMRLRLHPNRRRVSRKKRRNPTFLRPALCRPDASQIQRCVHRARAVRKSATAPARPEIIADEANNALLILGTRRQYRQVRAALAQLDVVPLQVLIEATIAEIILTDELGHGLNGSFVIRRVTRWRYST